MTQITSRYTIALHTLICIAYFSKSRKVTSNFIAGSVNVNPVIIRRILGQLKEAGIVTVEAGVGGAHIAGDPAHITLLDVFRAVDCMDQDFFHFHENPNPACPVGRIIHGVLDKKLSAVQLAMEKAMEQTTLEALLQEARKEIGDSACE